jgi:hypothetical protein
MSRLWDTNDYWARTGADQLLGRNPAVAPGLLADRLEGDAPIDGDRAYTAALIRELRKRVDAGLRFWPEDDVPDIHRELFGAKAFADDDETAPLGSAANPYWWQRL